MVPDETERELTFGEKTVGITFNASIDPQVDHVKRLCATLIDIISAVKVGNPSPSWAQNVFFTAAFNAVIAAQMAVVKYITWKE